MQLDGTALILLGIGLAVGALATLLVVRRGDRVARARAERLAVELEEARDELTSHRAQVSQHFEETSHLFRDLTQRYTALYTHLAKGSREFSAGGAASLGPGPEATALGAGGEPPATRAQESDEVEVAAAG